MRQRAPLRDSVDVDRLWRVLAKSTKAITIHQPQPQHLTSQKLYVSMCFLFLCLNLITRENRIPGTRLLGLQNTNEFLFPCFWYVINAINFAANKEVSLKRYLKNRPTRGCCCQSSLSVWMYVDVCLFISSHFWVFGGKTQVLVVFFLLYFSYFNCLCLLL